MGRLDNSLFKRVLLGLALLCFAGALVVLGAILHRDLVPRLFGEGPAMEKNSVRLTYTTRYLRCDDIETITQEISRDKVDAFVSSLSPEWHAVGREDSGVQLLKEVDDYCPLHKRTRLVILTPKGNLAVYRGQEPDPRFLVKEYGSVHESMLEPKTREILRKGYMIEDDPDQVEEKVRLYLEGIID